jgi:hypothetical protein
VHFGQEFIREDRDVWLLELGGREYVYDFVRDDCLGDDLQDRMIQLFVRLAFAGQSFAKNCAPPEKPTSPRIRSASMCGTARSGRRELGKKGQRRVFFAPMRSAAIAVWDRPRRCTVRSGTKV